MENLTLSTLATFILLTGSAYASSVNDKWSYVGETGPDRWQAMCQNGKNQSPVNIINSLEANLPPLTLNYKAKTKEAIHNGHAIQLEFREGASMSIEGEKMKLLQAHFHSPSENTINGEHFPLEAHYVHQGTNGNLIVLAILYREGEHNKQIQKLIRHMPKKKGNKTRPKKLRATNLLPDNLDYYRYNGSLTTPPCSEGVTWIVLKSHPTLSEKPIKAFKAPFHGPANRPVQTLNARYILK